MNQVLRQLGGKICHFDGAMGTMLQERGLLPGESPELWGLAHREEIVQIHRAYLEAGADFLKTNTFGANRFKLEGFKLEGSGHTVEEVVTAGVENALQAVEACGHGTVFLDIGPTGKLLRPLGELDFEEAVSAFGEMVQAGCRAGAQGILLETMSDIYEAKAALLAAKENSDLPVFVTMTFDGDGKLLTGGDIGVAAAVRLWCLSCGSLPACLWWSTPTRGFPWSGTAQPITMWGPRNSPAGWVKSPGKAPGLWADAAAPPRSTSRKWPLPARACGASPSPPPPGLWSPRASAGWNSAPSL